MNTTERNNGSIRDGGISTELQSAIQELEFVKMELELYLDTHPYCKVALDYYHRTVDALAELRERYRAGGGMLFAADSTGAEKWDWINEPWPWFRGDEIMKRMDMRKEK